MESDFELDIQEETYHKLTNTDSANLESSLTLEEISLTLKNDRSPGSSGFNVNFFKVFWKDVRAINYYLENRKLSITQKQGIIICIPKESKSKL